MKPNFTSRHACFTSRHACLCCEAFSRDQFDECKNAFIFVFVGFYVLLKPGQLLIHCKHIILGTNFECFQFFSLKASIPSVMKVIASTAPRNASITPIQEIVYCCKLLKKYCCQIVENELYFEIQ